VAFSPQVNYTDLTAAACRRSLCQLLRVEVCYVVSALVPHHHLYHPRRVLAQTVVFSLISVLTFPFFFQWFIAVSLFYLRYFSLPCSLFLFVWSEFWKVVEAAFSHQRDERPESRNWVTFVSVTGTRMEDHTRGLGKCPASSCTRSLRTKPSTLSQLSSPMQGTTLV
jgi:hypothetical protein